jgi:hypothetical protein
VSCAVIFGIALILVAACNGQSCSGPGCVTPTPLLPATPVPMPAPLVPLSVEPGNFTVPILIALTTQLISPVTGSRDGCGSPPNLVVPEPVKTGSRTLQLSPGGTVTDPIGVPGSNTAPLLAFTIGAVEIQPGPDLPPTAGQSIDVAGTTDLTEAIANVLTGVTLDDAVPAAQVTAGVNLAGWYTYLSQTGQRTTSGVLNFSVPNRCRVFNFTLTIDLL